MFIWLGVFVLIRVLVGVLKLGVVLKFFVCLVVNGVLDRVKILILFISWFIWL